MTLKNKKEKLTIAQCIGFWPANQIKIKSKSFQIWILKDFLCQDLDLDLIWNIC